MKTYPTTENPWSPRREIPWPICVGTIERNWDSLSNCVAEKGILFLMLCRLRGEECWLIGIVLEGCYLLDLLWANLGNNYE
jgi:hypothetical protein